MLRVYKRLLLFLFQLIVADVATLVRQVQKKKRDLLPYNNVYFKKKVVILKEVFFVCNDSTVKVVKLWGEETLIWISSWFSVMKH